MFLRIACAIDRISHEVKQRKATYFAIGVAVVDSAIKHYVKFKLPKIIMKRSEYIIHTNVTPLIEHTKVFSNV